MCPTGEDLNTTVEKVRTSAAFNAQIRAESADVSLEPDVGRLGQIVQKQFGNLDILVFNPDVLDHRDAAKEEVDWGAWSQTSSINTLGRILCCRAFIPLLRQAPSFRERSRVLEPWRFRIREPATVRRDHAHLHWEQKKKRSQGVKNDSIDQYYDLARANGALGGKLIGAGGGGFLLFHTEDTNPAATHNVDGRSAPGSFSF